MAPADHVGEVLRLLRCGLTTPALVEAGILAQGLIDAEFERLGRDDLTDLHVAAMDFVVAVASEQGAEGSAESLQAIGLPPRVLCRAPEGYAFYAVYPEAYAAAASAHPWAGRPLVLGLRSIGTSLAAAVAVATGGEAISLRPCGPPFRRELRVSERLRHRLATHAGPFAVVDEGPGQSGSSFGAAGDLLEQMGVPLERMIFMPSHGGAPGPAASAVHRERWENVRRLVRTLDDCLSDRSVGAWFEADIGPPQRVRDLSGGAWRARWPERRRSPVAASQERRKFALRTSDEEFVARFSGLDQNSAAKLERARALHAAGFAPEPVAVRNGFHLERVAPASPLGPDRRVRFLAHLGRYLRFRRDTFPAGEHDGGDAAQLIEMSITNAFELGGDELAAAVQRRVQRLPEAARRRVFVDGRMHVWEWGEAAGGFCKFDALDHACGHDLVGAQDIGWDVAAACVEYGLTDDEADWLANAAGAAPVDLPAFRCAYAAFQAGLWSYAAAGASPRDGVRARAQVGRYARRLCAEAQVGEAS